MSLTFPLAVDDLPLVVAGVPFLVLLGILVGDARPDDWLALLGCRWRPVFLAGPTPSQLSNDKLLPALLGGRLPGLLPGRLVGRLPARPRVPEGLRRLLLLGDEVLLLERGNRNPKLRSVSLAWWSLESGVCL